MTSPDPIDIRTSLMRLAAPALGLLVFGGMIIRGLLAGNPAQTILIRAIGGLVAGVLLGTVAGLIAQHVICDQARSSVPASDDDKPEAVDDGVAATGA